MAKIKSILGFLVIGLSILLTNSCTEDNPVIQLPDEYSGATENGDLEVFVRQETVAGVYIGGAFVYIYLTESARLNDNVYLMNMTPTDPAIISSQGALFKNLDFQKYWIRAKYTQLGIDWVAEGDSYVPKGTKIQVHIVSVS